MNKTQNNALASLSRAFLRCKKANLCFQGMDDALLAFDVSEYAKLTEIESICEQQYKKNGNQGKKVNTHTCYRDSGGW